MGVHELVLDLKKLRSSGIRKTRLEKVPALREALGLLHPDISDSELRFELEALLDQAADRLSEPHARGVRLALDIHGAVVPLLTDDTKKVPSSRDRRLAFANHYGVSEFNARDKTGGPSLEEQDFALLAGAILDLIGKRSPGGADAGRIQADLPSPPDPPAPVPPVAVDAVDTLRQHADAAEAMGVWDLAASWTFALVALVGRRAGETGGDHESTLRDDCLRASQASMMAGRFDEAEDHLRNALQIGQTLLDLDPANDSHQLALATALVCRSGLHWATASGSLGDEEGLDRAVELLRELVERCPDDLPRREMLALGLHQFGTQISLADDDERAMEVLTESLDQHERLLTAAPDDLAYRVLASNALSTLGSLHVFADRVQEGEAMLLRARDTLESLVEATSSDPWVRALLEQLPIMLAQILYSLAVAYGSADRLADAAVALRRAESFIESATVLEPHRTAPVVAPGVGRLTAQVLFMLGLTHLEEADEGAAQEYLGRARELDRQLLAGNPGNADVLELVLAHLEMLEEIWQETGQFAEAEQARAEARDLRRLHANQERRETGW